MEGELNTSVIWNPELEVSVCVDWDEGAVKNVINLLKEDCTIPFIARYRKQLTKNMDVDKLREVKEKYEELEVVQKKVDTAVKSIKKLGKLNNKLLQSFRNSKTINEVENLFLPFKQGGKRTLAERARELGLEKYALHVLQTPGYDCQDLQSVVGTQKKGLASIVEVENGVQHLIADHIAKDGETMEKVREIYKTAYIKVETTRSKKTEKEEKAESCKSLGKRTDPQKYELYFNFSIPLKYIKPHQVMAINRGESLKVLTVKFSIPDSVKQNFVRYCEGKYMGNKVTPDSRKLISRGVDDAYKRLIEPLMIRQLKSDLTKSAENASIDVFAKNLKSLLLTPPVRGKVVLGLDPGFKNGCKYAVTSCSGNVLDTGVLYLLTSSKAVETRKLKEVILQYRCETVAIGNGTACRETESYLTQHITQGTFKPMNVQYCIVNESGASIYSASDEAKAEFPDMDVCLRGAVSIARRLQDPLSELVKIEPRHIGVGMYQHDCPEVKLKKSLDGVIEECVSFTGVDLNVASQFLLRRIAGLNTAKAKKILEYRSERGGFVCRDELRAIKTIGPKTYEQCAGFVRILPATRGQAHKEDSDGNQEVSTVTTKGRKRKGETVTRKSKKAKLEEKGPAAPNPLDMTSIHPESYHIADRLIEEMKLEKENIGQDDFISTVKSYLKWTDLESLSSKLSTCVPTIAFIVDSLQQKIGHDIREEFEKPLFKQGVMRLDSVKSGSVLTGRVVNTTHFGAFVDIGLETSGLLHSSKINPTLLRGKPSLAIGDKVEVKVQNIDNNRKRIGLILMKVLS